MVKTLTNGTPGAISLQQLANRLGVCKRTARRYIRLGRVDAFQLPGGGYRITEESYRAFFERLETTSSSGGPGTIEPGARATRETSRVRRPSNGDSK